jgi:uncharacterized OB-fold protein
MCPSCHSLAWKPVDMPMAGTIHSFVITHFPQVPSFEYPLPILLVDLDPPADARADDMTVRVVMNTVGNTSDGLEVGRRVRIVIESTDPDMKLPFAIVDNNESSAS